MRHAKYIVNHGDDNNQKTSNCSIINRQRVPQYLAASAVTLGGLSFGTCLGYTSPALPNLESSGVFPDLQTSHKSWIGSLLTVGALFGSFCGGHLMARIGRKSTLLLLGFPLILGWMLIFLASSICMIYAGRFLNGFAIGALSVVAPVYLSEITQPEIRGFIGAIFQVVVVIGILLASIIGSICSWNILAAVCAVFPLIFEIATLFIPESPRYLLQARRRNDALNVLCWLRSSDPLSPSQQIIDECDEIEAATQCKHDVHFSDLIKFPAAKPFSIALGLMFFNQFCGSNAVGFYTVSIFQSAELEMDAYLSCILSVSVQVLATVLASFFVDKVGRRTMLLFSFTIMALALSTLGTFIPLKNYFHLKEYGGIVGWIPVGCIVVFNAAYSGGLGCTVWTVMSEILPSHLIGIASGLATSFNWILAFVITRYFNDLNEILGIHNTFWLFGGACFVGLIFVSICVPETKGKTLDQIQEDNFHGDQTLRKTNAEIVSAAGSKLCLV